MSTLSPRSGNRSPSSVKKAKSPRLSTLYDGLESKVSKAESQKAFKEVTKIIADNFDYVSILHQAVTLIPKGMSIVQIDTGRGVIPFTYRDYLDVAKNYKRSIKELGTLQKTIRKVRAPTPGKTNKLPGAYVFIGNPEVQSAVYQFIASDDGSRFGVVNGQPFVKTLPTLINQGVAHTRTMATLFFIFNSLQTDNATYNNLLNQYFVNGQGMYPAIKDPNDMLNLNSLSTYDVVKYKDEAKKGDNELLMKVHNLRSADEAAKLTSKSKSAGAGRSSKWNAESDKRMPSGKGAVISSANSLTYKKAVELADQSRSNDFLRRFVEAALVALFPGSDQPPQPASPNYGPAEEELARVVQWFAQIKALRPKK